MTQRPLPRVAVLGAGPIGLEAALALHEQNVPVTVFEAGLVGEFVQRWGFVTLFSPFGMNVTPLGRQILHREKPKHKLPADTDLTTGRAWRDEYLLPLSETLQEQIHTQTAVISVSRTGWRKTDTPPAGQPLPPFRLLVRTAQGQERIETADVVLDCTGTYARPNWMGDGGIPAIGELAARPHVTHGLPDILGADMGKFANRTVLVVGGGYTAGTTVCQLAKLAEQEQSTWVVWLARGGRGGPLSRIPNDPLKERDRLAAKANSLATRCDANVEFHTISAIEEVICGGADQPVSVKVRIGSKLKTFEAERLIANVGSRPDTTLFQELHVQEPAGACETGERGYYILGAKSHGRNSQFLLRTGHEQVTRVVAQILGLPAGRRAA